MRDPFEHVIGRSGYATSDRHELHRIGIDDYVARAAGASSPSVFSISPKSTGKSEADHPFTDNWTVYVCTRLLARAVSAVQLRVWRSAEDDAEEVPASHWLPTLLARPNRDTSWSQFVAAGMTHRKLSGEDFWFLCDAVGAPIVPLASVEHAKSSGAEPPRIPQPVQMVCVSGNSITDARDGLGLVRTWSYGGSTRQSDLFPPASVLHFFDYDPGDPQRGIGDAEVARRHIQTAFQAERYQDAIMRGGGPGAYLIDKTGPIDPTELERRQDKMNAAARDPENARRSKILTGEWAVVPNPTNPKDMLVLEHMRWSRDAIASIFNVPLPCINVLESATYSNMKEAWRQFWIGVVDYLRGVEGVINSAFVVNLEDQEAASFYVGFDYDAIEALKQDATDRFKAAADISARGVGLSFAGAAATLGLDVDPIESSAVVMTPMGMVPLDAEVPGADIEMPDANSAALVSDASVQDAALNGAQISSLIEVVAAVSTGTLTEDGAVALLLVAVPTIDEGEARRIVSGAVVLPEPEVPAPVPVEPDPEKSLFSSKPLSEAARREYARSFETRVMRKHSRKMHLAVVRWLTEYEAATKARLRAFAKGGAKNVSAGEPSAPRAPDDADTLMDVVERATFAQIDRLLLEREARWAKLLAEYTGPTLRSVFDASLREAADEFSGVSLPMTDPRVQRFLAAQKIQLSEGVTSTVTQRVRSALIEALGEPSSIGDLQTAVREKLPELTESLGRVFGTKDARALTIARTELGKASGSAKFLQYGEEGVTEIQWITSHDDAVRDLHVPRDGATVSYGSEFAPGLRYPRDENGSAEEVINCRCDYIGLKEDDPT